MEQFDCDTDHIIKNHGPGLRIRPMERLLRERSFSEKIYFINKLHSVLRQDYYQSLSAELAIILFQANSY